MLRKLIAKHTDRYLARWVIFLFDLFMVVIAFILATLMRFNFDFAAAGDSNAPAKVGLVVFFYAIGFLVSRSYVGIIRHTNLTDALNVVKGASFAVACLVGLSFIESYSAPDQGSLYLPRSIIAIHFLTTLFFLIGARLLVKYIYDSLVVNRVKQPTRVLIYGAGSSGVTTLNTLTQDKSRDFSIVGFIDDNTSKHSKAIGGVQVFGPDRVFNKRFMDRIHPDQLIISIQKSLTPDKKQEIVDHALEYGLKVRIVPPLEEWIHGELSAKQIKAIRIEDLLERDPIVLDNVNISREIKDKVILVTGAAGSIGSEIARQLLYYKPEKIILFDQAESALYDLDLDIKDKHPDKANLLEVVVGDVANERRMRRIFEVFHPQIVFHAAAYKHVPLMESNPYEAVNTNIFGTKVVADLSQENNVDKFVLVSTDKAVNPTNVMGATKRTAEIYTQSLTSRRGNNTQFIITRFGNVLGSNGSVIPLFKKQIEKGGPVTVTHKGITRYFMTIPEACNLVLEAGSMGQGGEIFVFDMGESVKIYDLAKKMIRLSGLEVGKDIEIKEIGLRPGEKLHEELLAIKENTKNTYHPKIMIARVDEYAHQTVKEQLSNLSECLSAGDNLELVRCVKKIVPEYISNNSVFASLDLKKIVNE